MEKSEFQAATSESLILVPAVGALSTGEAVCFLFSISQVEDILGSLDYSGVPFAPSYVEGMSDWRGLALPVISLECLLGLAEQGCSYDGTRMLVVRKTASSPEPEHWKRAFIRIAPGCRLLGDVPQTEPLYAGDYLPEERLPAVKGLYRWEEGLLLVPDLDCILRGDS